MNINSYRDFLHNLSFPRHCNLTWTQALPVENYKIKTQSAGCTKVYVIHLLRVSDRKGRKRQIVPAKSQNSEFESKLSNMLSKRGQGFVHELPAGEASPPFARLVAVTKYLEISTSNMGVNFKLELIINSRQPNIVP